MVDNIEQQIFKSGSTTYYFSSKFFPSKIRLDVFKLYSFVRVADDYVDISPVKLTEFAKLRKLWAKIYADQDHDLQPQPKDNINLRVIKNIVFVSRKYSFDPAWVEAFLDSMQMDIDCKKYNTLQDTLDYIYGSAEVIGLMMARIMGLPAEADETAKLQGRAMQFINFIRDIDEDNKLGRSYFPAEDLKTAGLSSLSSSVALASPENFKKFIQLQLQRYLQWQYQADDGLQYIPGRLRIPLKTAIAMYNWTAQQIKEDPFVVYHKKVKPSKSRIILKASGNIFGIY